MPLVVPLALPYLQLFDAVGDPLAGGLLYTYNAGTTTPVATYMDAAGTAINTNPVVANAAGIMQVYLLAGTAYKLQVVSAPPANVTLYTIDNVLLGAQATALNVGGTSPTVAAMQLGVDPGEVGSESLATSMAGEIQRLRFALAELKDNNLQWYETYRDTLAQFRLGTDPGEVGTESLPNSLAGEIQRLRFVIREMKGTLQWYETYVPRIAGLGRTTYVVAGWSDGVNTAYQWEIPAPLGMNFAMNSTVKMYVTNSVAGGNVNFAYTALLIRDGQPQFGLGFTAAPWTPLAANTSYLRFFEFGPNVFQGNDVIIFQLLRQGTDNVLDTNTGIVAAIGGWFEYTGVASR